MNAIIDLQEILPNNWKAKYQGNFGVYTIKIETDGKKANRFSCSCPSSYNPCKHISIVQNAIIERINKGEKRKEKNVFEDVVRKTSLSNLQDFVLRFGTYNNTFQQAFLLEFVPKQKQSAKEATSDYAEIIREESGKDTNEI